MKTRIEIVIDGNPSKEQAAKVARELAHFLDGGTWFPERGVSVHVSADGSLGELQKLGLIQD